MKVKLTRKLADMIDGVDLVGCQPGDVFELPPEKARLIVAEKWAIPERRTHPPGSNPRGRRADDQPPA